MNKSLNQQSPKKDLYYLNITNENITCRTSGLYYANCNFIVIYNVFNKYLVAIIKLLRYISNIPKKLNVFFMNKSLNQQSPKKKKKKKIFTVIAQVNDTI